MYVMEQLAFLCLTAPSVNSF